MEERAEAGSIWQAVRPTTAEERRLAAAAAATCRWRRLRDVLEFLLDLAVPEQAASQYLA
ncbi:MAG: hypothetical protein ACKOWG_14300 [Planctomycetia bacterium]